MEHRELVLHLLAELLDQLNVLRDLLHGLGKVRWIKHDVGQCGSRASEQGHAAVDRRGRLLRLVLTPGHNGDCPQAKPLLSDLKPGTVAHVIADAAYDSDDLRQHVRQLRARCCIRPNPTRKRKKRYDRERYKHRNVIERFFCRVRRCRRVATRYEKKAANYAGFVYLAAFVTTED